MKKEVTSKAILIDSLDQLQNFEKVKKKQSIQNNRYFNFFDDSPISLWVEDFSVVKKQIDSLVKESDTDIKTYIANNPDIIVKLASLVKVKEVNKAAVKLYNAKSKEDLLANLHNVFTENSNIGFSKLFTDILLGENKTEIETFNKTLDGKEINTLVKFKVIEGSESTLENVIVSVENITEQVQIRTTLINTEKKTQRSLQYYQ